MPDAPIQVGLVGAGRIAGLIHLPVLARLSGARLAAVAEPDDDARAVVGARFRGVRLYRALDEMLDGTDLDAIVVCAPPAAHVDLACAAFAAGKPIYLEKPIALSVAEGRRVIDAQRAAGTIGMIGFMLRFSRPFVEARELIASGAIGEVVGARSVFVTPPIAEGGWRRCRASGGGAPHDLVSHHIDATRWLLGTEVAAVAARLRSVRTENDTAAVRMTTSTGVTVQTFACMTAVEDHRFEVVGTDGRIAIDPWRMVAPERFGLARVGGVDRLRLLASRRRRHRPDYHGPFRSALSSFVTAVRTGRPAGPDLIDGVASLAVVEAAERGARTGAEEAVLSIDLIRT